MRDRTFFQWTSTTCCRYGKKQYREEAADPHSNSPLGYEEFTAAIPYGIRDEITEANSLLRHLCALKDGAQQLSKSVSEGVSNLIGPSFAPVSCIGSTLPSKDINGVGFFIA